MVKTTQWYCLVVFLWTRTRHTPVFWWWKKLRAEAKSEGYCSHAGSYRITTGPWRNLCRKHTWKTVSRLWVFWFPIGYLNWVQKGRLCPLWTKVAEIGKNWKNWKMRNGLRFSRIIHAYDKRLTENASTSLNNEKTSWPTAGTSGWSALISHPRP